MKHRTDPPSCIANIIPIGIYAANDVNRIEQHIPPRKNAKRERHNLLDLDVVVVVLVLPSLLSFIV